MPLLCTFHQSLLRKRGACCSQGLNFHQAESWAHMRAVGPDIRALRGFHLRLNLPVSHKLRAEPGQQHLWLQCHHTGDGLKGWLHTHMHALTHTWICTLIHTVDTNRCTLHTHTLILWTFTQTNIYTNTHWVYARQTKTHSLKQQLHMKGMLLRVKMLT